MSSQSPVFEYFWDSKVTQLLDCDVPAEGVQLHVSFGLQRGHPDEQLAQNVLQQLLHLLGTEARMQRHLQLNLLHVALEVVPQRVQSPLGLLEPPGTGTGGAVRGQHGHLDTAQELDRLSDQSTVAAQRVHGLAEAGLS